MIPGSITVTSTMDNLMHSPPHSLLLQPLPPSPPPPPPSPPLARPQGNGCTDVPEVIRISAKTATTQRLGRLWAPAAPASTVGGCCCRTQKWLRQVHRVAARLFSLSWRFCVGSIATGSDLKDSLTVVYAAVAVCHCCNFRRRIFGRCGSKK